MTGAAVVQQVNPADASNNATTGQPEGGDRLLAGKYKTVEELERGYSMQQTETRKIIEARDVALRQLETVLPLIERGVAGAPNTAGPASTSDPISNLLESLNKGESVTREQLAGAVQAVARAEVAPIMDALSARQSAVAALPEFVKFENEIAQFVEANPTLKSEVQAMMAKGLSTQALKYSYGEWQRQMASATTPSQKSDASGTQHATHKLDSLLTGGGSARASVDADATIARINAARDRMAKTGSLADKMAYASVALTEETDYR